MGIALIILGSILIGVGIYFFSRHDSEFSNKFESHIDVNAQTTNQTALPDEDPHSKGKAFEDFVVDLLADWRLTLLERTQDTVSPKGVYAESCKNPDLHISQKRGERDIDYYIECKYRSSWNNGRVTLDDYQMKRYRQFQRDNHRKVLIALGVGGSPDHPDTFMLVPIDSMPGNSIYASNMQYIVNPSSTEFVNYMYNYFTEVFNATQSRKN